MAMKVETVILGPDTDQYAGRGQPVTNIGHIAEVSKRMEALGFDGVTTPEAGHDPFLPIPLIAEHTRDIRIGTNVAIAFPRSPMSVAHVRWPSRVRWYWSENSRPRVSASRSRASIRSPR